MVMAEHLPTYEEKRASVMTRKTGTSLERIRGFTSLADHDASTLEEGHVTLLRFDSTRSGASSTMASRSTRSWTLWGR
jgi:hypothetical protein